MTPAQVQAAKIVIAKVVPDLKAVELTGPEGGPVQNNVVVSFVGKPA
jgi:hypothetical protein